MWKGDRDAMAALKAARMRYDKRYPDKPMPLSRAGKRVRSTGASDVTPTRTLNAAERAIEMAEREAERRLASVRMSPQIDPILRREPETDENTPYREDSASEDGSDLSEEPDCKRHDDDNSVSSLVDVLDPDDSFSIGSHDEINFNY